MAPWTRYAAPLYKNTGSVARDHLASERTFLAWTRTGLGFVALGIAIERFSQLDLHGLFRCDSCKSMAPPPDTKHEDQAKGNSHAMVGVLLTLGSGSIVYGTWRYFSVLKLLEKGEFRPAWRGVAGMGAAMAGLAGGVFAETLRNWNEGREDFR